MMTPADEANVARTGQPITSNARKFGTDLRTSSRANRSSTKKVVKVRKSSSTKKRSNKARDSESPTATESRTTEINSSNDASDLAYSVVFEPGSIGLKLEPVVESMGREVGCRVLDFADGGQEDPGQARKHGQIRPGDLLVAIDGRDVISWNYPDIIALLRRTAEARRKLAFRSVWTLTESADDPDKALPTTVTQEKTVEVSASTTPVRLREASYEYMNEDIALTQSPAESVLHSHFLSTPALQPDAVADLVPTVTLDSEETDTSQSVASQSFDPDIDDDDSCLSPSRVRELSSSSDDSTGRTTPLPSKPLSNVVKTVYNSVAPAAGVVASSSYSLTSTLTSAMSLKLGEALVGHKSKDFDTAVQLKMQLLSELSQAKVTLDRNLEEQRRLKALGRLLTEERDSERQAREEAESALVAANEEKTKLELQLQEANRNVADMSEKLQVEQLKLRNTIKDSDVKVSDLESQMAALTSHAEQDRDRFENESFQREQDLRDHLSEANSTIKLLNDTIQSLQIEVKDKDAHLKEAERDIACVRSSLNDANESKKATGDRLRDLEQHDAGKDSKLRDNEIRLEQAAREYQALINERDKALKEIELLQSSVASRDNVQTRLEQDLDSAREQGKAELDRLMSTVSSLRNELAAKDFSLSTVVQTANNLQAELLAIKATGAEAQNEKLRVVEEDMKQLRAMTSEKDNKLALLDSKFNEARSCLEGMNAKLHEKIEAISVMSDREQKLQDENDSLRRRIHNLTHNVEQANNENRFLVIEKERVEKELSTVRNEVQLLQVKVDEAVKSRNTATEEVESLRESTRVLTECNENLRVDLDLTEMKLAASGMNFLSKTATLEEMRSVLATKDASADYTVAELESLRLEYNDAVQQAHELETLNSELSAELMTANERLAISESAKSELEEKVTFVEQQLIHTRQDLASSYSVALQQKNNELSTQLDGTVPMRRLMKDDEKVQEDMTERERKLKLLSEEVASSRSLVFRAKEEIFCLKQQHSNELHSIKNEFTAERAAAEQAHELVIDRFKREVDQACDLSKSLQKERDAANGQLAEVLETVKAQECRLNEEVRRLKTENQSLTSQVHGLEREKSDLDSCHRRSLQQVSFLSERLDRENENVLALKQSCDLAREESSRLRNEIEQMQKVHLEDIERMLEELDSRTEDEANEVLTKKLNDKNDARIKDLETSLARAQQEAEDLRSALEKARNAYEERINQLRMQHEASDKKWNEQLLAKEEEIVTISLRLDATENSLAEAQVERRALETKIVQAECRAADATSESERLSKRLVGIEDDLSAMANEIEMLVETNGQLERRLIQAKAARAAFEAEATKNLEVESTKEKIIAALNAKIEIGNEEKLVLMQKVENLKSDMYDLLIEKEDVEVEKEEAVRSLEETSGELRAARKAVQDVDDAKCSLQQQLSEANEKEVALKNELEDHKETLSELSRELENVRCDSAVKIEEQKLFIEGLETKSAALEKLVQELRHDCEKKNTALCSREEELARISDELESSKRELTSAKYKQEQAVLRAKELKQRLESTESLLAETKVSEDLVAKLEVTNRTLMNRVDELEAEQDEIMKDLREAETALASSVNRSYELKQHVDAGQVEVKRLSAQLQVLESSITRMKSERLLHEESTQQLRGQLTRAAEVKVDRAVSSFKNDSESKARNLVELATKLTARSRLIAQSKLFERTLISFIEKVMARIDFLLDTVSSHFLMLRSASREKMGRSAEALDLAMPLSSRNLTSLSSGDDLVLVVSSAKKDFEEFKAELQLLKQATDSGDTDSNAHLLAPPPTPRHSALSSNLSKMKALLKVDGRDDPAASREQLLLEIVDYTEVQIDGLIADLFASRRALESKEEALAELEDIVSMQESEKETLDKHLKSMEIYIKEMEDKASSNEFIDSSCECSLGSASRAAMKAATARSLANILQRDSNASARQALRKWSNNACAIKAVEQQRYVAEALARQLEITREKVAILKSHLKQSATMHRKDIKVSRVELS